MNGLMIKAYCSSAGRHEMHVFTDTGDFVGSSYMNSVGNFFEVDGVVARRGFGKYIYDFMAMYAHENDKYIMSAMDGDTREGAMNNWIRICNDSKFNKVPIPDTYRYIDYTNEEDDPQLFFASSLKPNSLYLKSKLNNEDVTHFVRFRELKEKYQNVFGNSYDMDCNKWIDEEYPISTFQLNKIFEEERSIKNIKNSKIKR